MRSEHVESIVVVWDTQDPSNHGWAWYAYGPREEYGQREDSGPLVGRRHCSDRTLAARARAAAGVARTRTPVKVSR